MKDLVIIGAGGFGREIVSMFFDSRDASEEWNFIGFIDDNAKGNTIEGYPIIGTIDDLLKMENKPYICVAIADPLTKRKIIDICHNNGFELATLIHPTAVIGTKCTIGEGCIICRNVIITVNAKIGRYCLLNVNCSIGHDTIVGDNCSMMSHTTMGGESNIGEGSYFGLHCTVINRVKIAPNCTFGAGSTVIKDITESGTYVGVPVKKIK